jgi:hypothetical protein
MVYIYVLFKNTFQFKIGCDGQVLLKNNKNQGFYLARNKPPVSRKNTYFAPLSQQITDVRNADS